jgi:probable F420-dependent oxidoreductase
LTTGIAVAFARNPMTVAVSASDLHRLSGGRFVLGLGSQIKPRITRRFSMPWSEPAARMREFIAAVRAIWQAWEQESSLDFRGDFYQHTLMTPMFAHGPSPWGWPKIQVAAVGPVMTAVVGEVADGMITHGFTTPAYVRDVTVPRLEVGLAAAGRSRGDIEVSVPAMAGVVGNERERQTRVTEIKSTIAFYGSTPAYRPVLAHHGLGELGDELHRMSKQGRWQEMAEIVPDEVVDIFAVLGDAKEVAAGIIERYGGVADRLQLGLAEDATTAELLDALRAGG